MPGMRKNKVYLGQKLTNVAANAAAASRTISLDVTRASQITVVLKLTAYASATALTVSSVEGIDAGVGTAEAPLPSVSIAAGTGTATDYTFSFALSGTDSTIYKHDCTSIDYLELVVGATAGGAGDTISAYVMAALDY